MGRSTDQPFRLVTAVGPAVPMEKLWPHESPKVSNKSQQLLHKMTGGPRTLLLDPQQLSRQTPMFTPRSSLARLVQWQCRIFCSKCKHAFTLVEMLVVIAILVLLAVIAMPAISRMAVSGQIAKSTAGLKQLSAGMGLYAAENNGDYPMAQAAAAAPGMSNYERANTAWFEGLFRLLYPEIRARLGPSGPYMRNHPLNPNGYKGTIFWSPASEPGADKAIASYGFNATLSTNNFRKYPLRFRGATTILVADNSGKTHSLSPEWANAHINPRYGASAPHAGDGRATVLFLDGHVEVWDGKTCEEINSNKSHKLWGDRL
jgi:prepilin-type N-terminal cleavage/methylation domain-containing protein/prepilin-type processing-associated H-X9-DG protein